MATQQQPPTVLDALREYYFHLEASIAHAGENATDSNVLARIGDDLDEYAAMVNEQSNLFQNDEFDVLKSNIALMRSDIRILYNQSLDQSHYGRPDVRSMVHTGRPGRPQINIDPAFLAWAYNRRSISALARFLGVGRTTLRNALVRNGLFTPSSAQRAQPSGQQNIVAIGLAEESEGETMDTLLPDDELLEPHIPIPAHLPEDVEEAAAELQLPFERPSSQSPQSLHHSAISDDDLDGLITHIRLHYRRAGIRMLDGMLRRLGHRVQYERIRHALLRVDPVRRVFERIRIRRRSYSVAGPNALWHHDGQHGLIRWGIIIHGFIDGYSRHITALQASANNLAETVLQVFLSATAQHGVPSRIRGDHGTENILVAAWMEERRGTRRGSYIWGRSVHNIRIERLWVDVTVQIGETWANFFVSLETRHGLDINNPGHIWLLHFLFLPYLNHDLQFFAESWNEHRIQIRGGPNRSPVDMFTFGMMTEGVRGDNLGDMMSNEELEVYGIDWDGLVEDRVLDAHRVNNSSNEGSSSWIGEAGPPPHLNEVRVVSPEIPIDPQELFEIISRFFGNEEATDEISRINLWVTALACARELDNRLF